MPLSGRIQYPFHHLATARRVCCAAEEAASLQRPCKATPVTAGTQPQNLTSCYYEQGYAIASDVDKSRDCCRGNNLRPAPTSQQPCGTSTSSGLPTTAAGHAAAGTYTRLLGEYMTPAATDGVYDRLEHHRSQQVYGEQMGSPHAAASVEPLSGRYRASSDPVSASWFHGHIDRVEANRRLRMSARSCGRNTGVFLLREKVHGLAFALSVLRDGQCEHHLLEKARRRDGSIGNHWVLNDTHRLTLCHTLTDVISLLSVGLEGLAAHGGTVPPKLTCAATVVTADSATRRQGDRPRSG